MEEVPFLVSLFIPGVLVPAVVAAGTLALARWYGRSPGGWSDRVGGAAAIAAGYGAAYVAFPWTRWRPEEPWDWLPSLVALTGLTEALALPRVPRHVGWFVRVVLAALCGWLLVPSLPGLEATHIYWVVRTAAVVGLLWFVLERPPAEPPGLMRPALLAAV